MVMVVGDGPESETFRSKDINVETNTEGFGDGILDIYDYGTGANEYGNLNQVLPPEIQQQHILKTLMATEYLIIWTLHPMELPLTLKTIN
jgi:hypothetical protein